MCVAEGVAVRVLLPVAVALPLSALDVDTLAVALDVCVAEPLQLSVAVVDVLADADGVAVADVAAERVALCDALDDAEAVTDASAVRVAEIVALRETLVVAVAVPLSAPSLCSSRPHPMQVHLGVGPQVWQQRRRA